MIGGFKSSSLAIAAVAGFSLGSIALTPAQAADLGGDCCADLEERVAELEATTVRKGNRRLSLTLSGHVNQAVVFFDQDLGNGVGDSDIYVVDNDNSMTRFRLRGAAKFKPGWEAGIYIELGVRDSASSGVGPGDVDNSATQILIRHSNWYMSSPLGRIQVGQGSGAADGVTEIDLSGSSVVGYANGDSVINPRNFGITGYFSADGNRHNNVRYDTPTFAGFTASASWGEDDRVEAALRYAGEFNGLRVAAGVGYVWTNDQTPFGPAFAGGDDDFLDSDRWGASMSVWHVPTGIFVTAAYNEFLDFEPILGLAADADLDVSSFYVKAGLRRRFIPLGQTIIYGEYGETSREYLVGGVVTNGDSDFYGFGMVQRIAAAATELYLGYRRYEGAALDDDGVVDPALGNGELDVITAGARIRF